MSIVVTPVIEKQYQLILWTLPKLANFPKDQKYLLTDRIEKLMLDILELLIEAHYSKEKRNLLIKANLQLDKVRYLIRMAKDMKYINLRAYDYLTDRLLEIGRMMGGWVKTVRG